MPYWVERLTNVTKDNPNFFSRVQSLPESFIKICKSIDDRVSWCKARLKRRKNIVIEKAIIYLLEHKSFLRSKLLSKEIGRWLETVVGSPPLKTGETLASLKHSGTSPLCNDRLKKEQTGRDIATANLRMVRLLMPPGPEAFPTGSNLRMDSTSSVVV